MKGISLFIFLSTIFIVNSSFNVKLLIKFLTDNQQLSKNICKITNDIINSKTDTQDILVGNFGGKMWPSTINNILQCIDDKAPVVVVDVRTKLTDKSLRKASVMILMMHSLNEVNLIYLLRSFLPHLSDLNDDNQLQNGLGPFIEKII